MAMHLKFTYDEHDDQVAADLRRLARGVYGDCRGVFACRGRRRLPISARACRAKEVRMLMNELIAKL